MIQITGVAFLALTTQWPKLDIYLKAKKDIISYFKLLTNVELAILQLTVVSVG